MSALLTALIFFFAFLPVLSAQEESPLSQWVKDHVKGSFRYKNFAHFKDTEPEQRTVRQEGILRLEVDQAFQEDWRFFLVPQWKADTANYTASPFQDFRDTYLRDSYFYIREGHIKYRGDSFDLAVGKQFYSWGTADGSNPTDNLNPRDYHDVPDREKMGIFSFSASYYPPDASLTLVVIPLFTPSRLPVIHSRWIGNPTKKPTSANDPGVLNADLPPGVSLKRRAMPGKELEKIQVGLRAKKSIAGWDLSLSYFDGFDTMPVVRLTTSTSARPVFNRMRVVGADFSTTSGKLEYHGEWAWRLYESGRASSIFPIVLGGMYTWDEDWVKAIGLEQIIFNFEYARDFTLHHRDNPNFRESGVFTRPFRESILTRVALKFDENNELHISGNPNFYGHNNYFLQPKFIHKFSDSLKMEGGWELFWGSQNSFWGKWKRNDRTFVLLTYLF